MNHCFVIVLCAFVSTLVNAQYDTSVTKAPWFWPLIAVCLVLVFVVPFVAIIVTYICFIKGKTSDDSDESSIRSVSASSIPIQPRRARRVPRYSRAMFSPPPPYTYTQPLRPIGHTSPPAYEDPPTAPVDNGQAPSTTVPEDQSSPADTSLPLNTSLQTFQA